MDFPSSDNSAPNGTHDLAGDPDNCSIPSGRIRVIELDKLQCHPAYLRHGIAVSSAKIEALMALGEVAFKDPLLIASGGVVLDGYARWELARRQGRSSLLCIEYELAEEDSVRWLLNRHRQLKGFNDFTRILIALELEPMRRSEANGNQRIGGYLKGSSNLTEAARIDVRKEVADAAGVSVGNVTKVKQILASAAPEVISALKSGELSIHMAWKWSEMDCRAQLRELEQKRDQRPIRKFIHQVISRHRKTRKRAIRNVGTLMTQLSGCDSLTLKTVEVSILRTPGRTVFITEELSNLLGCRQFPICDTNDR
jgi:hypothetical protein